MEIKKILVITITGLLFLASVISFSQWNNAKKEITEITALNKKKEAENKKLIEANTKLDKNIDELTKKYDAINKELAEIKAESTENYSY